MMQRRRLLSKLPLFDREARHTITAFSMLMIEQKVERNQILLKQGQRCPYLILIDGKTQLRELRQIKFGKQSRVVETGSQRAPCMLNQPVLSDDTERLRQ